MVSVIKRETVCIAYVCGCVMDLLDAMDFVRRDLKYLAPLQQRCVR